MIVSGFIVCILFLLIIFISSMVTIFRDYKDCFSKDKRDRSKFRSLYPGWKIALIIAVVSGLGLLMISSLLIHSFTSQEAFNEVFGTNTTI
ncbi:hypothetical protein NPA07_03265 [Mycoplasmopsis caviae]|uniref:Uncharacterized protein n=1 Tax=Mycoplasmopsis caviae TaxID=55603 RepID=A0A3P8LBB3_9BACT|nr:hypothetical protein [Mycoplasmopsis caviae]UUD34816.1 hypothetical protein NPA07_03265 [Mycoplasmopsis caviae]VDR42331.1 Uncharacterised protein [Mycoplasmopsis caviae]